MTSKKHSFLAKAKSVNDAIAETVMEMHLGLTSLVMALFVLSTLGLTFLLTLLFNALGIPASFISMK